MRKLNLSPELNQAIDEFEAARNELRQIRERTLRHQLAPVRSNAETRRNEFFLPTTANDEVRVMKLAIWGLPTVMLEADLADVTVPGWIKELIQQRLASRRAWANPTT